MFFYLLRQCATDISLSVARAGRSVPLFLKYRLKFNDAFFINGDTRQAFFAAFAGMKKRMVARSGDIATMAPVSIIRCVMPRSSKTRTTRSRSSARTPLSRELLLPLPASTVSSLSLENHLALAALRAGHNSVDLMARLVNVVGAARYLHEADHGRGTSGQAVFDTAWQALLRCINGGRGGTCETLVEADFSALEQLVTLHDRQMATTPVHLLLAARERLNRYYRREGSASTGSENAACQAMADRL